MLLGSLKDPQLPTVRFFALCVLAPGKPGARTRRGWCGSEPERASDEGSQGGGSAVRWSRGPWETRKRAREGERGRAGQKGAA